MVAWVPMTPIRPLRVVATARHRGQDHLDDGHVVAFAGVAQAGRGCRVAGDDQRLDAAAHEVVADGQRVRPNVGDRQRAVGPVAGVADVDDVLVGQLIDDRPRDGEPSDAGVEDPDGRQWFAHVFQRGDAVPAVLFDRALRSGADNQ